MINTSIKKKGLKHCISVSECKAVLFGGELSAPIAEIVDQLPSHVAFYGVTDGGRGARILASEISGSRRCHRERVCCRTTSRHSRRRGHARHIRLHIHIGDDRSSESCKDPPLKDGVVWRVYGTWV